ncbi:hypothetical protein A8C56_22425 [Niabella ginsenosidivorans]|uniref:Uncharacterized protein n=2 Tax=Niabella ginsenosidivorans TaxID=1176587 RepID=A0A1A9IA04_9BACT|nr:hypothetical protein A8C56_22425 [Niabella ginsenosidivorans]
MLLHLWGNADGQNNSSVFFPDTTSLPQVYYTTFKGNEPIYNGRLFEAYSPLITGSPYLGEPKWDLGAACYDGVWYKDLNLRYDVYAGTLIIENRLKVPVILSNEKLSAFYLGNRKFLQLGPDFDKSLTRAFYEILNEATLPVLILRKKYIKEWIDQTQSKVNREFTWNSKFYIYRNGACYQVQSQKDLTTILKLRKAAVKKALRKAHIRFKTNMEAAILTTVQLYNQQ